MKPISPHAIGARTTSLLLAVPMLGLLVLPVLALVLATTPADLTAGARHPLFAQAFWLSVHTTMIAMLVILACGTPLAWWLATARTRQTRAVELLARLPIVIPPAVVGIGLLQTFGRNGVFGPLFQALDLQVPFSTVAVVLAQVVVAAPFYIQSAASAFQRVDPDLMIVARTLGQRPAGVFLRVALPLAMPGLIGGASLSWARALGEFGATLLFAGNLPGVTQTMPLAIYTALESDVHMAPALSLTLAVTGLSLITILRGLPALWIRRRTTPRTVHASEPHLNRPKRSVIRQEASDWQVRLNARMGTFDLDVDLRGGSAPVMLIGPNGAGKTTLLRLITGVYEPHAGLIRIGDDVLYDSERKLTRSPEQRRVAYVPQGHGLFPHLNVTDNVAFGLHAVRPRLSRDHRRKAATALLTDLEATHLVNRLPATLSGGEQQRAALARALLIHPLLLLLDEPLASLDARARRTTRAYLAAQLADREHPTIVITHDARDVLALGADVYAIEDGKIVQHGPAERIASEPATPFLTEFFDSVTADPPPSA